MVHYIRNLDYREQPIFLPDTEFKYNPFYGDYVVEISTGKVYYITNLKFTCKDGITGYRIKVTYVDTLYNYFCSDGNINKLKINESIEKIDKESRFITAGMILLILGWLLLMLICLIGYIS